jgi:hypothetical protein
MLPGRSDVPSSGQRFSSGGSDVRAVRVFAGFAGAAVAVALLVAYVRVGADARQELAAGEARSAELDVEIHLYRACGAQQHQLVSEVVAGRMGLAEAADDVLEVSRARPGWLHGLARTFPDDPDDRVRVARVLLACVKEQAVDDPDRGGEAVGRVTAEFEEMTDAADD